MPLSEIVRAIEQEPGFRHFDGIEWDDDGYWHIDYITKDGSRLEVEINPVRAEALVACAAI
jgi:Uri superfamily endonuclease